jgi:hypothetical protein
MGFLLKKQARFAENPGYYDKRTAQKNMGALHKIRVRGNFYGTRGRGTA